jgi:DNA-binding beta-propeller fold protein YncE
VFDVSGSTPRFLQFIDLGSGGNGVTTAPDLQKVFVGLTDSSLAVVDVNPTSATYNTQIAKLPSGGKKRVDEMDYDPVNKKLYAANSDDGIVTAVDAVSNQIITQWTDLGPSLEQPRYNPSDGMMYMTSSEQNALFVFDPRTDTLVRKMSVGDDTCNPNGLAINPTNNMGVLGCSNAGDQHADIWDFNQQKVVSRVTTTGRVDGAIYAPTVDRFLLASRYFRGASITVLGGDGRFITNVGPTDANSHQVAFAAATNSIFTIMVPDGKTVDLAAFALPR